MDCADADPSLTIPGTGSDMILVLEPKSFKPFKSKDEYMYAMKEDLAEWFTCLYKCCITVDNFFEVLETGVELCKHANAVRKFAIEQQDQLGNKSQFIRHIPNGEIQYKKEVKSQTFQARDNVSNFISWCRDIGVPEVLRFETDDLVLRKNERSVVLCLLEVARVGAKLGMLAPTIVQMEEEIDAELAGEPPPPTKQIITCDLKSLDEMVRELVGKCTCPSQFPIIKVGEGKYKIGDSQTLIFVRILRNHVMVRVGGGWDTLENYLDKHDPCRCHFKGGAREKKPGHRGSNQSPAVKRPQVRRSSAPSGQILADHINQRSPKKTPLSSSSCKQGGYVLSTPPRSESPVSGRSGKRSSCQTSSAECSQHSSTENLHRTPCQSPAKHSSKMLPPSSVGKTPTSPAKRAASPASTSSLASSSLRSSASSSLSASSEKLNSSESKSSGGRLDMDQISTMTLEQFKNLLNNQLITTAKEQAPSIESSSSRLTRQKAEIGSTSNKLQNPSTKNVNGQGRGPKQTLVSRTADQSPDISRRMRSPSPNLQSQSSENAAPEGPSSGLKPRGKRSGLSFLPRPNMQSTPQLNGESKIPMKRSGGTGIAQVPRPVTPSGETRAQRSLPTTPKQERKYNRTLPPRQMTEGSNIGKQTNSSIKRGTIMQRATTPGPRSQTPTKIEARRSSTPGLRELQIFSNTGNANLTDDTQSSADEESGGLKTPTPGRRSSSRSQSALSSRSSSTHSLNLAVKGDIPIEDPRVTSYAAGYAERWRKNKRASSAARGNVNASSPDLITVSRTQSGGHSVVLGKPSASEIRSGLTMGKASKSDLSKDTTDAMRRARSIVRNSSKIARSQSADRFSQRQRSGSISSVEDNGDTQWSRDRPQQRRLSELGIKTSIAARSNSLKYERSGRPRRGGSVTPNSIDVCDFDLSSRPLEEITAALIPVNGIVPQVSDPNELDAPPEDPEMYEQMEKLFEAYRQKELRDMVEATDRSKDSLTITLDRQDDDDDSRGNNTDISSLDSNANLPVSGQSSLTGSRRSSFQRTSDAESVEKMPGAVKEQNKSQSGGSRIPSSRIPAPRTCRIPAPKSKIGSGIPKSASGHQKNGVKTYSSVDYPDDNSASPSDCHEFLTSDQVSDNSRRTSYSDESSISTSDTSTNNVGQRLETPVPKVAMPLTTGRQRLIRPEIRLDKSKLVKAVSDTPHYGQKYLHDDEDEEDETF